MGFAATGLPACSVLSVGTPFPSRVLLSGGRVFAVLLCEVDRWPAVPAVRKGGALLHESGQRHPLPAGRTQMRAQERRISERMEGSVRVRRCTVRIFGTFDIPSRVRYHGRHVRVHGTAGSGVLVKYRLFARFFDERFFHPAQTTFGGKKFSRRQVRACYQACPCGFG